MARAKWKLPFVNSLLLENALPVVNSIVEQKNNIRNSVILEEFVGLSFYVYNGKTFILLKIKSFMVGHKFGEFAFTKKIAKCTKKKK